MDMDSWFSSDDPVAAVDPADLRSVWTMQRDVQANVPNQQFVIDFRLFERACTPGADTQAVWYRVSMLQLLAGPMGLLSRWLRDGEPADAVFKVAATFPMKRMYVGIVHQGPPFDVQEFNEQIEKQYPLPFCFLQRAGHSLRSFPPPPMVRNRRRIADEFVEWLACVLQLCFEARGAVAISAVTAKEIAVP